MEEERRTGTARDINGERERERTEREGERESARERENDEEIGKKKLQTVKCGGFSEKLTRSFILRSSSFWTTRKYIEQE